MADLNGQQFERTLFHGTKHDIKHLVRPSKDTDLDNYDYGESLPKAHREHTFAMSSKAHEPDWTGDAPEGGRALGRKYAEAAAWDWARGPGRARVHEVEPATTEGKTKRDPNIIGAVMHRGAMRVKGTTWIPPVNHARTTEDTANWEHVGPGGYQFTRRTTDSGLDIEDRSEHVQGTLPPLNWDQHHRYYSSDYDGLGKVAARNERNTALVDSINERFEPADPEWHEAKAINEKYERTLPGYNQDPLFPAGQYYDPQGEVRAAARRR